MSIDGEQIDAFTTRSSPRVPDVGQQLSATETEQREKSAGPAWGLVVVLVSRPRVDAEIDARTADDSSRHEGDSIVV